MAVTATVLFVAVLALTAWGWLTIPAEGRFPISLGVPPSVDGTVGKRTGLVLFLLIGLWVYLLTSFAASEDMQIGWIGIALTLFFLAMEYRLIRRLATFEGRGTDG